MKEKWTRPLNLKPQFLNDHWTTHLISLWHHNSGTDKSAAWSVTIWSVWWNADFEPHYVYMEEKTKISNQLYIFVYKFL